MSQYRMSENRICTKLEPFLNKTTCDKIDLAENWMIPDFGHSLYNFTAL